MTTMPKLDLELLENTLSAEEFDLARRIVADRGKNKGCLRASKPTVDNARDPNSGKAAYIWRMVAFLISPNYQHHCMPVTADWDLPLDDSLELRTRFDNRTDMTNELDKVVDKIVDTVDPEKWAGAKRWARALGVGR